MQKAYFGFIGFGEAAYCICKGLQEVSAPEIVAYDIMANDEKAGPGIRERAKDANVQLVNSLEELTQRTDYFLNATSAKFAASIAKEISSYLKEGMVYADLNSASPMVKRDIAGIIGKSNALFTDAAVMELVPPNRHRVPISVSGTGAKEFTEHFNKVGMNITYIDENAGSSSSMKMFRSIFMKGFTCLMLETLLASYQMGVSEKIFESINATLTEKPLTDNVNLLINRTAVGAARRVSEMKDVVATLKEMDLPAFASQATVDRLQWMCDLGLYDYFEGKAPKDYTEVLKAILQKIH